MGVLFDVSIRNQDCIVVFTYHVLHTPRRKERDDQLTISFILSILR